MAWCERNRIGYIFGLAGNPVLNRMVQGDITRTLMDRDAHPELEKVRRHGAFRYGAASWKVERRAIARVEVSPQGPTPVSLSPILRAWSMSFMRSTTALAAKPRT